MEVMFMELRVLEYFLAVAREHSISAAAEFLHLTQPTLSRQLKDLEDEFGKQLFIRGNRKVTLTEDGVYFRKKAEEIVTLAQRTEAEMKNTDQTIAGDIYIGAGETDAVHNLIRVAHQLQKEFGGIHFHITSGDTADLTDRLDKGLFDFCLLLGEIDQSKYEYLSLPYTDTWGILMHKDSPLAEKKAIQARDLWNKPLIISRQILNVPKFMRWFEKPASELNIVATYNLAFNASIMAREHMGYVLTLDKLINTEGTDLCFRPLSPKQTIGMVLVWKKYQPKSKAAEKFIETLSGFCG
jgi:DNA-binding transcriptional LysR family regulator